MHRVIWSLMLLLEIAISSSAFAQDMGVDDDMFSCTRENLSSLERKFKEESDCQFSDQAWYVVSNFLCLSPESEQADKLIQQHVAETIFSRWSQGEEFGSGYLDRSSVSMLKGFKYPEFGCNSEGRLYINAEGDGHSQWSYKFRLVQKGWLLVEVESDVE